MTPPEFSRVQSRFLLLRAGMLGRNSGEGQSDSRELAKLRVLGFGLLQKGDVGVGVFPHGEEVLVNLS